MKKWTKSQSKTARAVMIVLLWVALLNPAFADFRSWLLESAPAVYQTKTLIPDIEPVLNVSTQRCLSCHNGAYSTHITVKSAKSAMQIQGFMNVNHPVGMNYDEYVQRKPGSYRPRSMLDPKIQFVDGQVSCISCHQLQDRQSARRAQSSGGLMKVSFNSSKAESCLASNHLTAGPRQTDLCLTCHIK